MLASWKTQGAFFFLKQKFNFICDGEIKMNWEMKTKATKKNIQKIGMKYPVIWRSMTDLNPPIIMICKILMIQVGSNVESVELNPDLIDFNIVPNDELHSAPVTT